MNTTSFRARSIACALATTALCGLTATPAAAQTSPTYRNLDANGVDLVRGDFLTTLPEGSIGSGDAELTLLRMLGATGGSGTEAFSQWDHIALSVTSSGTWIDFGSRLDRFPGAESRGSALSGSGNSYQYRSPDGTLVNFGDPTPGGDINHFCDGSGTQTSCMLLPTTITSPDGKVVSINYEFWTLCVETANTSGPPYYLPMPDEPSTIDCQYTPRIASVTNSYGYEIRFAYASPTNSAATTTPPATFHRRTGASFYNNNAGSSALASVSYAYPSTGVTDITDQGGRVWRVTSSPTNYAIRRPGASSNTTSAALSGGVVTSVTSEGVTTNYSRSVSGSNATMTVTNALSQSTTVVSNLTLGRPTSVTDPLSRTTAYQYDTAGRLKRATAPEGNYVEYTYDARGNVTQTQAVPKAGSGLATITTSATFAASCVDNPSCNQPLTTTDARGNVTDYTYDSDHGGLLTVTGPAPTSGATRPQARYIYTLTNGEYQLTGTSTCQTQAGASGSTPAACVGTADEMVSTAAYDSNGNVTSTTTGNGSGTLTATTAMTYDAKGDLTNVDGPLSGTADTVKMRYNAARQMIGTVSPDPDGSGSLKHRASRTTIDATTGLPTKTEQGTVNSQSDSDWAAFATLQEVQTSYDANARPTVQKLVAGGTTHALSQVSYDAVGRVDCTAQRMNPAAFTTLPSSACTLGTQGTGTGDFGPDRIVKTTYDAAGQVTKTTSAYGVTGQQADDVTATYTSNGKTQTVKDAENNLTTYQYDGHDRLAKTYFPSATKGAGTSNGSDYEELGFDAGSNVTSLRNRAGQTISLSYDALNRLTVKDLPDSGALITDAHYRYDNLGRMTGVGYSASSVLIGFSYDWLGRMTQENHSDFGAKTFAYDLAGRRTRMTWKDNVYVDYDYLVTGEMSAIRENGATSGIGVLASFGYDDLGRRTSLTRGNGTVTSYGYDAVSRLTSLGQDFAGTTHDLTLGFGYTPAGQIASNSRSNDLYAWTGHGSGTTSGTANGLNQLTANGSATLTYDAKGNLTNDGTRAYTYASDNRMATGGAGGLYYDPLGRLSWYQNQAGVTDYAGSEAVAELENGTYAFKRRFVFGPGTDETLVWYEGTGTTDRRFLHADERGSIVAVSNGSGAVTNLNTYDEYGKPAATNVGRFQYTGQRWIPEIGLYDYKARMYDPRLGRFMQTDPIGYGAGMNVYGYVGGDPVNSNDPSGLCKDDKGRNVAAPTGTRICGGNSAAGTYGGIADHLSGSTTLGPGGAGGPTVGEAYEAARERFGAYGNAAVNEAAGYLLGRGSLALLATYLPVQSDGSGGYTSVSASWWAPVPPIVKGLEVLIELLHSTPAYGPAPIPRMESTPEIRAALMRIRLGVVDAHHNDGSVFRNDGSPLPDLDGVTYREYVLRTPGISHAGPQRLVIGTNGSVYYTPDHYGTFYYVGR